MNKTFLFLLLFILSACSSFNNQQGRQPFESRGGLTGTDNRVANPETVSFREGDITDIADINPNFLDLNRENEAHNNYGAYQGRLRQIVENSKVFKPGMIYINGGKAIVNVTPTRKLAKDELAKQRGALQNKLGTAVPRYEIEVRVNE